LDHLLARQPFATEATAIWQANRRVLFRLHVSAITPINVFYIARKLRGAEEARRIVASLLAACHVCSVDQETLQSALSLQMRDFEDAVQAACATASQLAAIVTRD